MSRAAEGVSSKAFLTLLRETWEKDGGVLADTMDAPISSALLSACPDPPIIAADRAATVATAIIVGIPLPNTATGFLRCFACLGLL